MTSPNYQYTVSNDETGEEYTKVVVADDEEQAIQGGFGLVGSEENSGFTVTVTEEDEDDE